MKPFGEGKNCAACADRAFLNAPPESVFWRIKQLRLLAFPCQDEIFAGALCMESHAHDRFMPLRSPVDDLEYRPGPSKVSDFPAGDSLPESFRLMATMNISETVRFRNLEVKREQMNPCLKSGQPPRRARGYFVSTGGRDETAIREYIRNREKKGQRLHQMNLWKWPATVKVAQLNRGHVGDPAQAALSGSHRKATARTRETYISGDRRAKLEGEFFDPVGNECRGRLAGLP